MTDEQKAMYMGICMCRNTEVNIFWQRNQVFTIVNLATIPLLVAKPVQVVYITTASAGVLFIIFWLEINRQAMAFIDYWHSRLAFMEPSEESPLVVFRVFTGKDWEEAGELLLFPSIFLTMFLPWFFGLGWVSVILLAYYM